MSFFSTTFDGFPVDGSNYNIIQSLISMSRTANITSLTCASNCTILTNGYFLSVSNINVNNGSTLILDNSGGGSIASIFNLTSGNLQLNLANDLPCNIINNGNLIFNLPYRDCIYYGSLSGLGTFKKTGAYNLTLTNINTISGAIRVMTGAMIVNGQILNSTITVDSSANISGFGSVGVLIISANATISSSKINNGLTVGSVSNKLAVGANIDLTNNIISLSTPTWIKITSGYYGFCGYTSLNKIYSWGNNYFGGALGINKFTECICGIDSCNTQISDIVTIYLTTYVLFSNGNLYGWGDNTYGQLGISAASNPQLKPIIIKTNVAKIIYRPYDPFNWISIQATSIYICDNSGVFWGAGSNYHGQLLNATNNSLSTGNNWVIIPAPTTFNATSITNLWISTIPYTSVYCRANNNRFYAAGNNGLAQLGNGIAGIDVTNSWNDISNLNYSLSLSGDYVINASCTGNTTNCLRTTVLLTLNGTVWTCGYNSDAECGNTINNGTVTPISTFTKVNLKYPVSQIYHSSLCTYVKYSDPSGIYTLARWGSGILGEMGNNSFQQINPYISQLDISDGDTVNNIFNCHTTLGSSGSIIFILKKSGLWVTGNNTSGNAGNGTKTNINTFTKITLPFDPQTIINIISSGARTSLIHTPTALYFSGDTTNGISLDMLNTSNTFIRIR